MRLTIVKNDQVVTQTHHFRGILFRLPILILSQIHSLQLKRAHMQIQLNEKKNAPQFKCLPEPS